MIQLSFNNIDSLNKTKAFSEYNFSFQEKTGGQIIFSQLIPPIATGFGIDASSYNVIYKYIAPAGAVGLVVANIPFVGLDKAFGS